MAKNIKDSSIDYHQDIDVNLLEMWFPRQLIPNISPNSVIVIVNVSYHGCQLSRVRLSVLITKTEIQNFLLTNDIF